MIHLPSFSIIQYKNREIRLAELAYFSEAVEGKSNIQYISFISQRLGVNIYQPAHIQFKYFSYSDGFVDSVSTFIKNILIRYRVFLSKISASFFA